MPDTGRTEAACIFCKIIEGVLPCARVYEDDSIIAFLDIQPIAPGHTLVVPKEHYPSLLEIPSRLGEPLLRALSKIGRAMQGVTQAQGFNCLQNNGPAAGQAVFHVHWHLIPRFDNDTLPQWQGGKYADATTMQELAQAIHANVR